MAKAKKYISLFTLSLLLIILAMLIFLFTYQRTYAGKVYKNVHYNEIDLGGMTKKQVETIIKSKALELLGKEIVLSAGNKNIKAKFEDTGVYFDLNQAVNDSYRIGRDDRFLRELFLSGQTLWKHQQLSFSPSVNEKKFNDFIKVAVEQLNSVPVDASVKIENGNISETQSIEGYSVNIEKLDEQIISLLGKNSASIELETITLDPKVKTADFAEAKKQAEEYLNKKITFTYSDKTFTPTKSDIGNWLMVQDSSENYKTVLNDTGIKAYLGNIATSFEIKKVDRKINAATGEIIQEGSAGLYLEKDKAVADLKSAITSTVIAVALTANQEQPGEVKIFPAEGLVAGRFAGKYVDIDLPQQKLCRIDGVNIIDCFIISSGKPSMPTPTGIYAIQSKSPRQWSAKYGLWMPYWEQFSGDYGLHELPEWPSGYKEGEAHLGTPVSHGCVRLGVGSAQTLYDWTEIGTPVYIHK